MPPDLPKIRKSVSIYCRSAPVNVPFFMWLARVYTTRQTLYFYEEGTAKHNLQTVWIGLLYGSNPKVYWKTPRPWKSGGANPISSFTFVCQWRSAEPEGLLTWSYKSFSPKENTGTKDALKIWPMHSYNYVI